MVPGLPWTMIDHISDRRCNQPSSDRWPATRTCDRPDCRSCKRLHDLLGVPLDRAANSGSVEIGLQKSYSLRQINHQPPRTKASGISYRSLLMRIRLRSPFRLSGAKFRVTIRFAGIGTNRLAHLKENCSRDPIGLLHYHRDVATTGAGSAKSRTLQPLVGPSPGRRESFSWHGSRAVEH